MSVLRVLSQGNVSLNESEGQLEERKRVGARSQRKMAWITRGMWQKTQVLCLDPFPDRNFIAWIPGSNVTLKNNLKWWDQELDLFTHKLLRCSTVQPSESRGARRQWTAAPSSAGGGITWHCWPQLCSRLAVVRASRDTCWHQLCRKEAVWKSQPGLTGTTSGCAASLMRQEGGWSGPGTAGLPSTGAGLHPSECQCSQNPHQGAPPFYCCCYIK